jgi:hypothetical protein
VFALSALVEAAVPVSSVPLVNDAVDLRSLPSEYRFPVTGVPALRLPKRPDLIAEALVTSSDRAPLLWTALTTPVHRVPLTSDLGQRRAALLAGCLVGDDIVVAEVRITVRPGPTRHSPPDLTDVALATAADPDAAMDLLELLWRDADKAARGAVSGPRALWLGGDPARAAPGGDMRVRGVCAAFGLHGELVVDAARHVRQVAARVGSSPPGYLLIWESQARAVEPAVAAFRAAAEGEVIRLVEPAFDDALLELRWALADLGLDGRPPPEPEATGRPAPVDGEERYYIKHHGSKAGDRMIEVVDCGHGQWGSDQQRKAPRAWKGITADVGVAPKTLFLCSKCTKNRWRARF